MALRRRTHAPLPLAALVAFAACSSDSVVSPTPAVEPDASSLDYDEVLARVAASPELSALTSPATRVLVAEGERMIRGEPRPGGGSGPRLGPPPVDPSLSPSVIVSVLFEVTLLLYENRFFADATGDPRPDRVIAIIHPIHFAAEGLGSGASDQVVAGLEATIEWYEQRNAEGMVPNDVTQWIIAYANVAIDQVGGPKATRTMCMSSTARSCLTAALTSIRWHVGPFETRLAHDFSYTFFDGVPARVEVRFRLTTGAPNCNLLGSPIATAGDAIWTVLIRGEPELTANPNNGGFTPFGCIPHGVIRGLQWDGIVVRDADGAILGSCGKSSRNPCFEPAAPGAD